MFYRLLLFIVCLLAQNILWAQFSSTVRSARPGQSLDPFSVGKGVYQWQNGFYSSGINQAEADFQQRSWSNRAVFRVGLTERLEINGAWNYQSKVQRFPNDTLHRNGIAQNAVGVRVALQEARGMLPALGAQIGLQFPALSSAYRNAYIAPIMVLIGSGQFSERLGYTFNLGMSYDGQGPKPRGLYTLNLAYSFAERWSVFVENYGNFTDLQFETGWNGGLAYLLHPNLQLDFYGGAGCNTLDGILQEDYFLSLGFTWRFHKRAS